MAYPPMESSLNLAARVLLVGVIRFRFPVINPPAVCIITPSQDLKSRVEERTGGAVTINLFEDAQLGNERDNIEGVQMGTIQMCLADTGYVATS